MINQEIGRHVANSSHTNNARNILEEKPEWQVVAEAGDGREAVRQAVALKPGIAVLDIGMPPLNGIEATAQIVRRVPEVKVLILSMHSQEACVSRALTT